VFMTSTSHTHHGPRCHKIRRIVFGLVPSSSKGLARYFNFVSFFFFKMLTFCSSSLESIVGAAVTAPENAEAVSATANSASISLLDVSDFESIGRKMPKGQGVDASLVGSTAPKHSTRKRKESK
jgi:hypothetical protein